MGQEVVPLLGVPLSSSECLIVQGLLSVTLAGPVGPKLMSTSGEGDLHGCRPIQGIECTLSQETHPLPGTQSRHRSCLGPQSTREAALVRGDGFVLCLAGRGEQAVPCCDIESGLVLSQLAKTGRMFPFCLSPSFRRCSCCLLSSVAAHSILVPELLLKLF